MNYIDFEVGEDLKKDLVSMSKNHKSSAVKCHKKQFNLEQKQQKKKRY